MIKSLLIASSLILSLNAFAAESSDVSIFGGSDVMHWSYKKLQKCLKGAWKSASPTEDQLSEAKTFIQSAKDVLAQQKDMIKKDKKELMRAWSKYPISSQAVEDAEMALRSDIVPVHKAYREAKINALNLLSLEQKKEFNTSFKSCYKKSVEEQEHEEEEFGSQD